MPTTTGAPGSAGRRSTTAGADTRRRLLNAALELVADGGVQAVTHRAVEERAGAARGSTRYHFGDRAHLLEALLAHVAERDHALVDDAFSVPAGAGLDDVLAHLAGLLARDRAGVLARFELYLHAARHPDLAEGVRTWADTYAARGARVLEGTVEGIDAQEASTRAALASAALDGLALHALLAGIDAPAVARRLAPAVLAPAPDASGPDATTS